MDQRLIQQTCVLDCACDAKLLAEVLLRLAVLSGQLQDKPQRIVAFTHGVVMTAIAEVLNGLL